MRNLIVAMFLNLPRLLLGQEGESFDFSQEELPKIVVDSLNATFLDSTAYRYSFELTLNDSVRDVLKESRSCLFEISYYYIKFHILGHKDEYNVGIGLYVPLAIYEFKEDKILVEISRSRYTPELEWRCLKHVLGQGLAVDGSKKS
jgi:hypothetical protein